MNRVLSAEERRLIDEAIAAGKVTKVPRGASSHAGFVYDPERKALVHVDTAAGIVRSPGHFLSRSKRREQNSPAVAERRGKVRTLHAEGLTVAQIAERLEVGEETVYRDIRRMHLVPNPARVSSPQVVERDARISQLEALLDDGTPRTAKELSALLGVSSTAFWKYMKLLGRELPRAVAKRRATPETMARREAIAAAAARGEPVVVREIARRYGTTSTAIYSDLKALGLSPVKKRKLTPPGSGDKAATVKEARAAERLAKVRDRRRFKSAPVPTGAVQRMVDPSTERTMFPTRVFEADGSEPVLKDGANNSKIGGDVLVGRLKGAKIFTLTLEERATCPRSCFHWRSCMGNAMQHARRWRHGSALEARLREEVAALCAQHRVVLIRLHVLGDFYSTAYVDLWRELLVRHSNLTLFGFTAWGPVTPIGGAISALRSEYPRRFMVRESGRSGRWGSFTVDFPTERKTIGDAVVCPEQRDAMDGGDKKIHCGSCAVCWSTDAPIVFVEH